MENISDIINDLPDRIDLEKTKGINALLQISLSGEGGGEWGAVIDDGKVEVKEGQLANPQLIIKASAENALKIMRDELNPVGAFMTGKIKIAGDMALGLKLLELMK